MNEREIFNAALQCESAHARSIFVAEACGDDNMLRQRVEFLLKSHDEAGSFMQNPPTFSQETCAVNPTFAQGTRTASISPDDLDSAHRQIGPY